MLEKDQLVEYRRLAKRWHDEIKQYDREFQDWEKRGKSVNDRYLDERRLNDAGTQTNLGARFNILWSNVETMLPAVYAKMPKPDVSRRYKDNDPVGRVAALLLERCLEFESEQYTDFHAGILNALMDRLLPGRGVAWIRYEPTFVQVPTAPTPANPEGVSKEPTTGQITEDATTYEDKLDNECSPIDYVNWQDFGHACAPRWEEVPGVWRCVYLTKDKLEERFGNLAEQYGYSVSDIPLDYEIKSMRDDSGHVQSDNYKRASIFEIWDKESKKVIWLCKDMDMPLDVRDDPLNLDKFFPCPKPLFSTTGTGSLVPVPDYCMYQDQARELDLVTERIQKLEEAVKVIGVYDATQTSIKRMLNEGVNNTLIPVDSWAVFAEKGGIKGVIDWLPLDQVVGALTALYQSREQIKQVIYEISGIADIVRGSTDPNETLGAQQLKANFASLRIRRLQAEVSEFARDCLRLRSEVICNLYSDQTILNMSGAKQLSPEDQQLIPKALQLLRDDVARDFRIDIETDSMVQVDEQAEKESRIEFITGISTFLEKSAPVVQVSPEMMPVMAEMLMFVVRGFKVGKSIEGVFDNAIQQMKQRQSQPDPAQQAQQETQQLEKERIGADVTKAKAQAFSAVTRAEADKVKAQSEVVRANADVAIAGMQPQGPMQ